MSLLIIPLCLCHPLELCLNHIHFLHNRTFQSCQLIQTFHAISKEDQQCPPSYLKFYSAIGDPFGNRRSQCKIGDFESAIGDLHAALVILNIYNQLPVLVNYS